jgi:hypothetical protein
MQDLGKIAAKQRAENVRKKLLESSSKLASEDGTEEDCVVKLGAREQSEDQTDQENQQKQGGRKNQEESANSEGANRSISDWA